MGLLRKNEKTLGLDISDLVLRAVQLKNHGRSTSFVAYNQIDLPSGIIKNGEILDPRALRDAIKKLISHPSYGRFTAKQVVASLPEAKSFFKVIEIPQVDNQQIDETIKWEITQHIPLSPDEMYMDWKALSTGTGGKLKIVICAIPKTIVDSYTAGLEDAGLRPIALIIESIAIAHNLISQKLENTTSALILDIGLNRTSFLVYEGGAVRFSASSKRVSGQAMTNLISQRLKLTDKQAERAKRMVGLDPTRGKAAIPKILDTYINKATQQIDEILKFYSAHHPGSKKIDQIIIIGGGANLRNLTDILSKKINKNIILGDPWSRFKNLKNTSIIPKNQHLSHSTVLGLASMCSSDIFENK
ncbi:type IV pilus assembly protein PilM [Patescibacteria group bacterium]|nr:type IV pilus assembly protein PilM [Patescibacteria group bacterium]MBU1890107.1 type IV pilus assembly protein PilM [Patescibacteria group bacterium]